MIMRTGKSTTNDIEDRRRLMIMIKRTVKRLLIMIKRTGKN
jgi:hypothetical protein